MNYPSFNYETVGMARRILKTLHNSPEIWPDARVLETIFHVNDAMQFTDVSFNRMETQVTLHRRFYYPIRKIPHLLVHNHPGGEMWPSDGDWGFAKTLSEFIYPCLGHLIVHPSFTRACLFDYGKGYLKIHLQPI